MGKKTIDQYIRAHEALKKVCRTENGFAVYTAGSNDKTVASAVDIPAHMVALVRLTQFGKLAPSSRGFSAGKGSPFPVLLKQYRERLDALEAEVAALKSTLAGGRYEARPNGVWSGPAAHSGVEQAGWR